MLRYQAAVFDLDGTLLNSLEDLADCMNLSLAARGFPPHPVDAYRFFVGDGMDTLARRAVPTGTDPEPHVEALVHGMRDAYASRWNAKSRPYDGIPELLRALTERGVRLTVLSNKHDDFTKKIVTALFGEVKWDVIFGARPNVPKKPDPAGALEVAALLNLPCTSIAYLGDTNTDMRTARGAGMFALGCTWGFRPAEELIAAGAHALVNHPLEALAHF
jgi:phosphoglycolate phosphatase